MVSEAQAGKSSGGFKRGWLVATAAPMVLVVAGLSWASYVALGDGLCGGSGGTPNIRADDPANSYCAFQDPAWRVGTVYGPLSFYRRFDGNPGPGKPLLNGPATWQRIRELLPLLFPVALAAIGFILGFLRRDPKYCYWLLGASLAASAAPWAAVVILRATG